MKTNTNTNNRIYVDVHVLQTVPPSCINRDDTGSPKTAIYGGVRRARVSSQSWKHAMRGYFKQLFDEDELAVRTKKVTNLVAERIQKLDTSMADDMAIKKASDILKLAGLKIKPDKKDSKQEVLDALFFMSMAQADALARIALEPYEDGKADKEVKECLKQALKSTPGIEVALFGRMVADDPTLNIDACAQVAHSISTHRVDLEYDYFTAVDDIVNDANAGAAHLDTVEFDSATLYRYTTVAVHELVKHLGVDTPEAIARYVEAFVKSMPDGKQNAFANRTLPDAVYITVRRDQPVNLSGAFEKPVRAGEEGYVSGSVRTLCRYVMETNAEFAGEPEFECCSGTAFGVYAKQAEKLGEEYRAEFAKGRPFTTALEQLKTKVAEDLGFEVTR